MSDMTAGHYRCKYATISAFILISFSFLACPIPLDLNMQLQVKDNLPPAISILTPADGSSYASTVVVTGTVQDISTESGKPGEIDTVSFQVMGTDINGNATINSDNSFILSFETVNLSGSLTIQLSATDWNGNLMTSTLTLIDDGAIPSLTVLSGNGEVSITWDPVPLAESYTLYFERANTIPNPLLTPADQIIADAQSGMKIEDLENGRMHTFLLQAVSSSGEDNWSEVVKSIPLSPFQLTPSITPDNNSILVEWIEIPDIQEYEVWKATSRSGPYYNISGSIYVNSFRDHSTERGINYYYSIKPARYSDTLSAANPGNLPAYVPFGARGVVGYSPCSDTKFTEIAGNTAYLSGNGIQFYTIDISNPDLPSRLGAIDFNMYPYENYSLSIENEYAYLGYRYSGNYGVMILNISDLSNPLEVSRTPVSFALDTINATDVVDGYAYIAGGDSGLLIIDVNNTSALIETDIIDTPGHAYDVAVLGNYAYVADGTSGLRIIDISDPYNPFNEGSIAISEDSRKAVIEGNRLYITTEPETGGDPCHLHVFNLTSPHSPTEICVVETGVFESEAYPAGDWAFMTDWSDFMTLNINEPDYTAPVDSWNLPDEPAITGTVSNGYAYVTTYYGSSNSEPYRFRIFDVGHPVLPAEVLSQTTLLGTSAVDGDIAGYIDSGVLQIYDISEPSSPVFSGSTAIDGASFLKFNGGFAFAMDYGNGYMHITDLSTPGAPVEIGSVSTPGNNCDIAFKGHYAYVADYTTGLQVIDISNPESPAIVSYVEGLGIAYGVSIRGDYAYVSCGSSGIRIIDISDPLAPFIAATDANHSLGIVIQEENLFTFNDTPDLFRILDISDPLVLTEIGTFSPGTSRVEDFEVHGDIAYLTDYYGGDLWIVDISDRAAPQQIAYITNQIRDFTVSGEYIYGQVMSTSKIIDLIPGN